MRAKLSALCHVFSDASCLRVCFLSAWYRRGGAPDEEQTKVFVDVVHKFISTKPLELIGLLLKANFNSYH